MDSPILRQIAKFLQERKNQKRWKVVFVALAVIVGIGTATGLRMMGLAMTHKERVLTCPYQVHKHTEECYDQENNVICGYADYVVHKHNDDCYNADLKLVCPLPEIEKHEHTKECYNEMVVLVCGQEEAVGHEHTDACYTKQKGSLACTAEEHKHTDACYDEEKNLTCNIEEHTHDDNCYNWEDVLTCTLPAGEGGHKHTEACYQKQEGLTCGQLEMHTHTEKCFEKIDKDGTYEPDNLRLVCDKMELVEHVHTEAMGCLKTVEVAPGETAEEAAKKEAENDSVFTTDLNGEGENGEDSAAAEGEEGTDGETAGDGTGEAAEGEEGADGEAAGDEAGTDGAAEGEEGADGETAGDEAADGIDVIESTKPEDYDETKTYEGLGYIVSASYNKEANIPEEAKLIAEQITERSDSEDYKKHEAEFKKNMGDENATMSALFKIGFYVDNEEVEPESPVLVTIQFVDKHGLPEGAPIKVVHFGDEDTEVIDGGKAESGSTSFKTKGFSKFAIGFSEKEKADAEKEASVHIKDSFEYDEGMFHIAFHVEGDAKILDDNVDIENINAEELKQRENMTDNEVSEDETSDNETSNEKPIEEEESDENSVEEETSEENDVQGTTDKKDDSAVAEDTQNKEITFDVELLDENSEEYQSANEYVENISQGSEVLLVRALRYTMAYKGAKLDLSQCDVTAKVTPTEKLTEYAEKTIIGDAEKEDVVIDKNDIDIEVNAISVSSNMQANKAASMSIAKDSNDKNMDVDCSDEPNGVLALSASSTTNPEFRVQYYAYLDRIDFGGSVVSDYTANTNIGEENRIAINTDYKNSIINNSLPFIDTKGGILPQNGKVPSTTTVKVDANGNVLKKSRESSLSEVYKEKKYEYIKAPAMKYFDVLLENEGYSIEEVWILKKGKSGDSNNKEDWRIYKKNEFANLHFTNRQLTADKIDDGDIFELIESDTVIRLVYDVTSGSRNSPAVFYDYDISDGNHAETKTEIVMETKENGINSSSNCNAAIKYAFGNNNASSMHGKDVWSGNALNMTNLNTGFGYAGCTFGLVSGTSGDNVNFNVDAPKVFGGDVQNGKTIYLGGQNEKYSLDFTRRGDTYTLTGVRGTDAQNLEKFTKPGGYNHIRSNNFWPMDGEQNNDIHFGGSNNKKIFTHGVKDGKDNKEGAPPSDDGLNHNAYFGMYYNVSFKLDEAYAGPLEYLFYGDDDMWVFLDGQLVCDIGGVHSSVGEYVDLWDYLRNPDGTPKAGNHTLQFYYTERGASGSSCWMQFTLPSITTMTPQIKESDYGKLRIGKDVSIDQGTSQDIDLNRDTFKFNIVLNGTKDDHRYTKYDKDGNVLEKNLVIWDGGSFTLKNGEYIVIEHLPEGVIYTITEENTAQIIEGTITKNSDYDYTTNVTVNGTSQGTDLADNKDATGTVHKNKEDKVKYENHIVVYELPETGGSGMIIYTIAGAICILLGAGFMYTKKAKERRV